MNHRDLYYLCLGPQVMYLLKENDFSSPSTMQFRYEQLQSVTCDERYRSLFSLKLTKQETSSEKTHSIDLILEAPDRTLVVNELKIRYRTALIAKTWNVLPHTLGNKSQNRKSSSGVDDDETTNTRRKSQLHRAHANLPLHLSVHQKGNVGGPFETIERPTFDRVQKWYEEKEPNVELHPLFENHFLPLHKNFVKSLVDDNEDAHDGHADAFYFGFKETQFQHATVERCKLEVKVVDQRNLFTAAKMNVGTLAERLSTFQLLVHDIDYDVTHSGGIKKVDFLFGDDKTVWEGHQFVVETLKDTPSPDVTHPKQTIATIVLRRLYIPPDADSYQDFVLKLHIPHDSSSVQQREKLIEQLRWGAQNIQPMPQCILYDTLFLRARLESLEHDEWFFSWCQRMFHLKPELLPLEVTISSDPSCAKFPVCRQEQFALSICNMILKQGEAMVIDPFDIEKDICCNVDSPDTMAKSSDVQKNHWQQKVSRYLAFYVGEGGFEADQKRKAIEKSYKLNWKSLVDAMDAESTVEKKHAFITLIDYFLHLRLYDAQYKYATPLERTIAAVEERDNAMMGAILHHMELNDLLLVGGESDIELSEEEKEQIKIEHVNVRWAMMAKSRQVCHMNIEVFMRLLRLDYFRKVEVSEENFVKLLTHALRLAGEQDTLLSLLHSISEMMDHGESNTLISSMFSYPPLLHALGSLLRYNDSSLLLAIGKILLRLAAESVAVRKWISASEYMRYILRHLSANKSTTQPAVCTLLCMIIQQCVDREETRQALAYTFGGVDALIDVLVHLAFSQKKIGSSRDFLTMSNPTLASHGDSNGQNTVQLEKGEENSMGANDEETLGEGKKMTCSVQRMELLEASTGALWVFLADDGVSGLAVNQGIVPVLLYIIRHVNCSTTLLTHLYGIFMVISSYQAYRSLIVQSDIITVIIATIRRAMQGEDAVKDKDRSFKEKSPLYRAALGTLLMLSSFTLAIRKMTENKLAQVLEALHDHPSLQTDAALVVIISRLCPLLPKELQEK